MKLKKLKIKVSLFPFEMKKKKKTVYSWIYHTNRFHQTSPCCLTAGSATTWFPHISRLSRDCLQIGLFGFCEALRNVLNDCNKGFPIMSCISEYPHGGVGNKHLQAVWISWCLSVWSQLFIIICCYIFTIFKSV